MPADPRNPVTRVSIFDRPEAPDDMPTGGGKQYRRPVGDPTHTTNSETVKVVGEYYRSQRGAIHLAPCRYIGGTTVRWNYGDGRSLHEIVDTVRAVPHLRLCRHCWPAEAIIVAEPGPGPGVDR